MVAIESGKKKAKMPPPPAFKRHHRYDGRFFVTSAVMEVMAVYHGISQEECPHTWQYRTLIAAYREIYNGNPYRKGYGPDWLVHIKDDIVEYLQEGAIPINALKFGAGQIRNAELRTWQERHSQKLLTERPFREAAE